MTKSCALKNDEKLHVTLWPNIFPLMWHLVTLWQPPPPSGVSHIIWMAPKGEKEESEVTTVRINLTIWKEILTEINPFWRFTHFHAFWGWPRIQFNSFYQTCKCDFRQKPLLGLAQSDHNNRMVIIVIDDFFCVIFTKDSLVNKTMKCDHNKRLVILTSDNIKRLSL